MKRAAAARIGYVDTSCLVAILFGERSAGALQRRLHSFEELVASNLLEAELQAVFVREGVEPVPSMLASISWVMPDRPLHAEIERVLEAGYLRGADCWHVATALYVADDPGSMTFLTLDVKQRDVAGTLGFAT